MNTKFSRRDFLKGTAAGALGLAAAGMGLGTQAFAEETAPAEEAAVSEYANTNDTTMPEWLGTAPEISDDMISEEISADVVVVGGGTAGTAAVKEIVDLGGSVILLEKCECVQGRSGDFGVINSPINIEKYGMKTEEPMKLVKDLMRDSGNMADFRTLKYWAEHSGEDFDWYMSSVPNLTYLETTATPAPEGVDYWVQPDRYPLPENYNPDEEEYPCYQTTVRVYPQHNVTLQFLYDDACAKGSVDGRFYTRAVRLLQDDTGRVTGVIAHDDQNDKYIRCNANRSVILATGDYSGDANMLHYYCPETDGVMAIFSSRDINNAAANTGDGHKMGMWIGAAMERTPHAPMVHNMGSEAMGNTPFLWVNMNGERFMNESVPGQQQEDQVEQQPGKVCWQIWDSNWRDQVPMMPAEHGCCCYVLPDGAINDGSVNSTLTHKDNYAFQEQIDDAIAAGNDQMADTLEELAEKIGVPTDAFLATVVRYNELAAKGEDEDFGKLAKRVLPIDTPPFYAGKITVNALLVCIGGLQSDADCHVYNKNQEIIPGLYAAGNTMGGRMNVQYPTTVPGISHAMALSFGRHAGENAFNQI